MTALEVVTTHPKIALLVCVANLFLSWHLNELAIPLIVMQIFQLIAWIITIIVGSITIYRVIAKFIKKLKSK